MNGFELLILLIYLMVLWYVYQSIVEEIDQKTAIQLNQAQLKQQLAQFNLVEAIALQFEFSKSPLSETIKSFKLTLENKSRDQYLMIHWQQSSLMDFDGLSQRLIRLPPGLNFDLFPAQASTVLPPREILVATLTTETCLTLTEGDRFTLDHAIFSPALLKEARDEELEFELTLMVQCSTFKSPDKSQEFAPVVYPIHCTFEVVKQPWQKSLYWQAKVNKKVSDQKKQDAQKGKRKARKKAKYQTLDP